MTTMICWTTSKGKLFACVVDEPGAPRSLRVKDYWTDYITVMWDSPEFDGGSPITSYIIEKRDVSRPTWLKAGNVDAECSQFKATNLFEGVEYSFRVFAVNKVGPSKQAAELDQPCKAKMPFGEFWSNLIYQTTDLEFMCTFQQCAIKKMWHCWFRYCLHCDILQFACMLTVTPYVTMFCSCSEVERRCNLCIK